MSAAPAAPRGRQAVDYAAKAIEAWGDPPDWVIALAEEANRTSASAVAGRLDYSASVISEVISNRYRGVVERVAEAVRGALMGATVRCPVLDEIGRDRCLAEQRMPRLATSSVRARLYRACRAGCPHSRIGGDHG